MARMSPKLSEFDRNSLLPMAALAVFAIAAGTILLALAFEYLGGYQPCPLCLKQRWAYYAGLPLAAGALIAALYEQRDPAILALTLAGAAFAVNAVFGVYHAGIEWHFWAGPTDCAGGALQTPTGDLLSALKTTRVIRCDQAAWRFLGISFAGYNALISAALATIAFAGVWLGSERRDWT